MEVLEAMFGAGFELALLLLALVALYLAHRALCGIRAYFKFREPRLVICPETREAAVVQIAARCAGMQAIWDKRDLRLRECSRWPARGDCPQDCLQQIEARPAEMNLSASCRASSAN
jgi:hypothetical protein